MHQLTDTIDMWILKFEWLSLLRNGVEIWYVTIRIFVSRTHGKESNHYGLSWVTTEARRISHQIKLNSGREFPLYIAEEPSSISF